MNYQDLVKIDEIFAFMSSNDIDAQKYINCYVIFHEMRNNELFCLELKNSNFKDIVKEQIYLSNRKLYLLKINILNYLNQSKFDYSFLDLPVNPRKFYEYTIITKNKKTLLCNIKKNNHSLYHNKDLLGKIIQNIKTSSENN